MKTNSNNSKTYTVEFSREGFTNALRDYNVSVGHTMFVDMSADLMVATIIALKAFVRSKWNERSRGVWTNEIRNAVRAIRSLRSAQFKYSAN